MEVSTFNDVVWVLPALLTLLELYDGLLLSQSSARVYWTCMVKANILELLTASHRTS